MSQYSLFSYWEVIATVIFGMIFFGETLTLHFVLGGILVVFAGILLKKQKSTIEQD